VVDAALPRTARPVFLRILPAPELTASFKYVTTRFKREGFDPAVLSDPLYAATGPGGRYEPLDRELHERIVAGTSRL